MLHLKSNALKTPANALHNYLQIELIRSYVNGPSTNGHAIFFQQHPLRQTNEGRHFERVHYADVTMRTIDTRNEYIVRAIKDSHIKGKIR